jgi:hypothetical protein
MNRLRLIAVVSALTALVAVPSAYAAGLWAGFTQIGGTGGPTVFQGTEAVPADLYATSTTPVSTVPSSAYVSVVQLGNGPAIDLTTVGTANVIPNNTPWYFLDGAQGSALTVTLPANPVEGQFQSVICSAATVGTVTIQGAAGQTVKTAPAAAACAVGTSYGFRYQASNTTWYRIR